MSEPVARFGLFVVFFWFGILKVIELSPATPLVKDLFQHLIPFLNFSTFLIAFGLFECVIGLMFLFKGYERIVIPLLLFHMVTTFMPMIFLPSETWQMFLVPTLEGQYIIKNLVIIAAAVGIAAHLHPIRHKSV
jgi:hypothetical protein